MKAISVYGLSDSGKTTSVVSIIQELCARGYTVGSVKRIHHGEFHMDTPGKNTDKHAHAGANTVAALASKETAVLFPRQLAIDELLKFYDQDFVIFEGYRGREFPKLLSLLDVADLDKEIDETVIGLVGVGVAGMTEYNGLPCFDARTQFKALVDFIEEKCIEYAPMYDEDCCSSCGSNCRDFRKKLIQGEVSKEECALFSGDVELTVGGKNITMVPFVQRILKNSVDAVLKELDGYFENADVQIRIKKTGK